ncbi:MAG: TrmH family RNA methyltransferase [Treponema sp.]
MIELFKLLRLPHTQKIRKIIKILEVLETEAAHGTRLSCDSFYLTGLCTHLSEIYPDDPAFSVRGGRYNALLHSEAAKPADIRNALNTLRHALYRQSGVQPSEWDLIAPGLHYGTVPAMPGETSGIRRPFYEGLYVYAEDIRAPFNLGSIFRTAEAFGAEQLFLSEGCVSPEQPRARRSAMGCTGFLPWEYRALDSLPAGLPVFALETGGTSISSFQFPPQGIVLIGSEELGLSTEALKKAADGIVSIPMKGIKASLNVAVAFGILMQCWTAALSMRAEG